MRVKYGLTAFVLSLITFFVSGIVHAEDIAGAKDHPLLGRYPDSVIRDYSQAYDSLEILVGSTGSPEQRRIEGDLTTIRYFYASADAQASPLQLLRNYQNAIKSIGGQVVYERLPAGSDSGETTLTVDTGGKTYWVRVTPDIFSAPIQSYQLQIIAVASMAQVITANQLLEELNKSGFVTLHLNFATGKSDLDTDGVAAVNQIVALMQTNLTLALSVEGHTDNVGDPATNKLLSESRAQSVMKAIVSGGIDMSRLAARGFGQEAPVADNRTEAGRAENRRVELVKKS